jgi:hypothetical protein
MLCKIWSFHGRDYETYFLLEFYETSSYLTGNISDTKSSQLMLCKIWGFHDGDNKECRLLGYINPVRTSQETHYESPTEPSKFMLWKVLRFHCGDYEEYFLWDTKSLFVPNRRQIKSPLQIPVAQCYVRFSDFLAMTMKYAGFCYVTPCELVVTANVIPSLLILFNLTMEAILSSEMSVPSRATRCHVLGDGTPCVRHVCKIQH